MASDRSEAQDLETLARLFVAGVYEAYLDLVDAGRGEFPSGDPIGDVEHMLEPLIEQAIVVDAVPLWIGRRSPASRSHRRSISPRTRREVFERDAYRCRHCGGWHDLTIDHIHPLSKGGTNAFDNLQTLCKTCNNRKGDRV